MTIDYVYHILEPTFSTRRQQVNRSRSRVRYGMRWKKPPGTTEGFPHILWYGCLLTYMFTDRLYSYKYDCTYISRRGALPSEWYRPYFAFPFAAENSLYTPFLMPP